jgi:1,4-alpha-glucan branching enzyme
VTTADPAPDVLPTSLLGDVDLHLFNEGSHLRLHDHLGAHPVEHEGTPGTHFAVWAPNAAEVSVIGEFNGWDPTAAPMTPRGMSGIWEAFVPGVGVGELYKYRIVSAASDHVVDKADPFAFHTQQAPATASVVWDLGYDWGDAEWMAERGARQAQQAPISIYELHMGSWRRGDDPDELMTYRDLADPLIEHVTELGFTHVEFLPVMEHPFYGSWGYQSTGYFAPSSRYGTPQDLMWLVDRLHQAGIGVILDWVPSHFPTDEFALGYFDGTHLYEHADPRQGFHPDWNSYIFNYTRHEVVSFLLSSAMYWLDRYHVDGIRVDAVASMLYLDYSREAGEWIPNAWGGNENVEAIEFLRRLNTEIYAAHPDVQTFAEESTAWPMVSRPVYVGGLGFGFKWDMGWMNDTLQYMQEEPINRKYHHDQLTFRSVYAFAENYCLPLSHDEVVHGKGSLLAKMPGDEWQQRANLRLLFGYMFTVPGKKLLFMGGEFGQEREWNHSHSLDWHLLDDDRHAGLQRWLGHVARLYRGEQALHELDTHPEGFEWLDASDWEQSIIAYLRRGHGTRDVLVVCNFTPVPRHGYRLGVPYAGFWRELANSDASEYGGSGQGNLGGLESTPVPSHGRLASLSLTLPPLSMVVLGGERTRSKVRSPRPVPSAPGPLTAPSGTVPGSGRPDQDATDDG